MKYVDEFRDPALARQYINAIADITTRSAGNPWTIMEVCGGQTHAIVRHGLSELLPPGINLVHGPGCPVCVTPLEMIDQAIEIAARSDVIFCSFGDMLRVPGSHKDLLSVRAEGGDVRTVYSPLDAVNVARDNPDKEVVFFAVGFETTAPANALAVKQAKEMGLANFSVLVSHVLVPPAIEAILSGVDNQVQAFLAAGHVCTIMGLDEYRPIVARYQVPIVVTGFEPIDILQGITMCIRQLEAGEARLENQYTRSVRDQGNLAAQDLLSDVFAITPRKWRGIGEIAASGWRLSKDYEQFDAAQRFGVCTHEKAEPADCISGLVLQGLKKPFECPAFGSKCTPDHPLGATMVSGEGACAAYYRYGRKKAC